MNLRREQSDQNSNHARYCDALMYHLSIFYDCHGIDE